jgi:hypothetical protein
MTNRDFIDRSQRLQSQVLDGDAKLELGCGDGKRDPSAIGIDLRDFPGVDVIGDVYLVLASLPDDCVSYVFASHFIEHIASLDELMSALARVVKRGGVIEFVAPHFSNPYFYSDVTHRTHFGLYSFCYLARSDLFRRRVPDYGLSHDFVLESAEFGFKSGRPFYVRHSLKLLIGKLVNMSTYTKEFYEENLPWMLPCYEVRYRIRNGDAAQ